LVVRTPSGGGGRQNSDSNIRLVSWPIVLNSVASAFPSTASIFAQVKGPLIEASSWGLLIAISALGLGTSLTAMLHSAGVMSQR